MYDLQSFIMLSYNMLKDRTEWGRIGSSVTVIFKDKIKLLIFLQYNFIQNRM